MIYSFNLFRIISPDIKETVACTAIREGDEVEWQFAFDRYLASNVAGEQDVLLAAMTCTEKPWILAKYNLNDSRTIRIEI